MHKLRDRRAGVLTLFSNCLSVFLRCFCRCSKRIDGSHVSAEMQYIDFPFAMRIEELVAVSNTGNHGEIYILRFIRHKAECVASFLQFAF